MKLSVIFVQIFEFSIIRLSDYKFPWQLKRLNKVLPNVDDDNNVFFATKCLTLSDAGVWTLET